MYLTEQFYVRLKKKEDYNILERYAAEYNVKIIGEGAFQPWYILRCKLKSEYNALELANIFYESGLYSATEPEIIGAVCLLPTTLQILTGKSQKFTKLLRDGQLLIQNGDKLYNAQGQEVR